MPLLRTAKDSTARCREWFRRLPRPRQFYYGVLGAVSFALAAFLVFGPKPWISGTAPRLAQGRSVHAQQYIVDGEYWAALVNLVLCIGLIAAARWILRPLPAQPGAPGTGTSSDPGLSKRVFFAGLTTAVILAAAFNAPRLDMSLWGDEELTMREFVIGEALRDEETGRFYVEELPWSRTIWGYHTTNNHILYSILGRISHSFTATPTAPDRPYFSETALRMPCFLSGLAAVIAVGLLAARLSSRGAGLAAAFLLALHPWFTRYGVEARGYALLLFLQPFAMIALLNALRYGAWRWWIAFGVCEFLLFWAFPGTVYFLFAINLAALGAILLSPAAAAAPADRMKLRIVRFTRFCVANLLGAMLTLQAFLPCIKPFGIWLARPRAHGELGWKWTQDALSYLGAGVPWRPWEAGNPHTDITFSVFRQSHPISFYALLATAALLLVAGMAALARRPNARWMLLPILLPLPLSYVHNTLTGNLMMHWYAVGSLPGLVILWAAGLDLVVSAVLTKCTRRTRLVAFAGAAIAVLAIYFAVTHPQRRTLWNYPIEPIYESVHATRDIINPLHQDIDKGVITVGFHMYSVGYDPAVVRIKSKHYVPGGEVERVSVAQFKETLREADLTGKTLYVNIAQTAFARLMLPKLTELLDDKRLFTLEKTFYGLQDPCTRFIYRYHPGSFPPKD